MHYKNGRPAQNGDKVVFINEYGAAIIGILYDAQANNDYCNGKLAVIAPNDPMPNLKECLHLDDVRTLLAVGTCPCCNYPKCGHTHPVGSGPVKESA